MERSYIFTMGEVRFFMCHFMNFMIIRHSNAAARVSQKFRYLYSAGCPMTDIVQWSEPEANLGVFSISIEQKIFLKTLS